jgi:hypothetical protein
MAQTRVRYQPPQIFDFGPIAANTFWVPPGTDKDSAKSHKGFTSPHSPDNSADCELSSSTGGPKWKTCDR